MIELSEAEVKLVDRLSQCTLSPAEITRLRHQFGTERTSYLLTIANLQPRARKKFGEGVWLANEKAIEQASDCAVARFKAGMIEPTTIVDLCSGVGGDTIEFAKRHRVLAIEANATVAKMLAANLRFAGATAAAVVCADAVEYTQRIKADWPKLTFHVDPDRRPGTGERVSAPHRYSPSLDDLKPLFDLAAGCMVKLAPAAQIETSFAARAHRQWISLDGSTREQTLISDSLADVNALRPGQCSAVRVHRNGSFDRFQPQDLDGNDVDITSTPSQFIHDIDPAIRAAGLSAAFATEHAWQALGAPSGFFTSPERSPANPLFQSFELLWSGPADQKLIKRKLTELGGRVSTIKVRGTDHEPTKMLQFLRDKKLSDGHEVVLFIGRTAAGVYAAIGRSTQSRLSPS